MLTVVLIVEGVLRLSGSDGRISEGVTLYRSLAAASRLYLVSHEWGRDDIDRWLFHGGLAGHIGYQWAPSYSPDDRINALSKISSWSPALVIEPDPECAALELRHGYPVCLFARPTYGELRWRPDAPTGPQPWDDVVTELKRQEELRRTDPRMRESS